MAKPDAFLHLPVEGHKPRSFTSVLQAKEKLFPVADATTFFTDLHHILKVIAAGNIRTLCHHRLVLLEQKFNLHLMLNADREFLAQKSAPHRDFYNVRKVDTSVHHSACMNQKGGGRVGHVAKECPINHDEGKNIVQPVEDKVGTQKWIQIQKPPQSQPARTYKKYEEDILEYSKAKDQEVSIENPDKVANQPNLVADLVKNVIFQSLLLRS
ncbi:hypothetical protein ACH5RR_026375 [Cinchona calisaya]|uniref:Polyprotein n=1 Tax=Cinchona calisaya TaxID=153742 RepID=A0ABD2Z2D4_9GENT